MQTSTTIESLTHASMTSKSMTSSITSNVLPSSHQSCISDDVDHEVTRDMLLFNINYWQYVDEMWL